MKLENLKEENVVLKFHAKWCGPCKILKTLTDNLDKEGVFNEYGYKLIEVDVDDFSDLAEEYNVRSLPTVFFMKKGDLIEKKVGLVNKNEIIKILNK